MSALKLSKEEYQKQKDLEAARKAGTAPPEVDEEGNEINPHIPQYIVQAPWYLNTGVPSLKHQRVLDQKSSALDSQWYARGQRAGKAASKFRKGACENCGAMTHKTKECMDRPRKKGARWTGENIEADEVIQNVELSFDAKRDRWNGYDAEEHVQRMAEWELVEAQRKKIKAKKLDEEMKRRALQEKETLDEVDASSDEEHDEDKYADLADMAGQKVDMKSRQTVRNLRIREDIPKYLRNLDLDSAHYDPKTRSMRDNPNKEKNPEELDYAGDNFVRYTGEARDMTQTMVFAWQAAERGNDVHLQANPSQAEFLYREYLQKKDHVRDKQKRGILERYGGAEHLQKPPTELLQQTESYVEYSRTGKVVKGVEKAPTRSKYMEDVHPQNHTSVWGSYWSNGQWGYACCFNVMYNSYCTGHAGRQANTDAERFAITLDTDGMKAGGGEEVERSRGGDDEVDGAADERNGQGEDHEGERRRKAAPPKSLVEEHRARLAEEAKRTGSSRLKRKAPVETDEDRVLEQHRLQRVRADDPMLQFKDTA